ncbi:MAG: hypothetical protein KDE56_20095 [Anaerolineales bacterium]|nr:hypothetical protein [Anaerolineales bacterium]
MAKNKSSISDAARYEQMGDFWDHHDFTDFDDPNLPDVAFDIQDAVRIETELLATIEKLALVRGVSAETLINLWLQEKVHQLATLS